MATFLTTDRMSPALRARVERSVRGGRDPVLGRRAFAFARLAIVASAVIAVIAFVSRARAQREKLETEVEDRRARIFGQLATMREGLADADAAAIERAMPFIERATAGEPGPEVVAPSARGPLGVVSIMSRPITYLRGPIDGFDESHLGETARGSDIDALAYCLLDPPATRREKEVRTRASAVDYPTGDIREKTKHLHRFSDIVEGMPFFSRPFREIIQSTSDIRVLERQERALSLAPIEQAKAAAAAHVLMIAVDEPSDGTGPTEIDGEAPHFVRLLIADLDTDEVLVSVRRHVDPSWISQARRAVDARALDSCALAHDLRLELARDVRAPLP